MSAPHIGNGRSNGRGNVSLRPLLLALLLCLGPSVAAGQVITDVIIEYPTISPNGDGVRDSSLVRVDLGQSCDRLLVILEAVSTSPIDTLLDVAAPPVGAYTCFFDGRDGSGALLPEGDYRLRVLARTGILFESITRLVTVDLTTPVVQLERIDPGIYAPGVPGTAASVLVYYTLIGTGPGDTLTMVVTNAAGGTQRTTISAPGDGENLFEYSTGMSSPDGIYHISLFCADEAGNSSSDGGALDVDTKGPEQWFVTDYPDTFTNVVPELLVGKAYDRNGIASDSLRWNGGALFAPDSAYLVGDTLYWRFDPTDFLHEGTGFAEGTHTLTAVCADPFGAASPAHRTQKTLTFILDTTPPGVPVLDPLPSTTRDPSVFVRGTVTADTRSVRLYRIAGGSVDSLLYTLAGEATSFTRSIDLVEGNNLITAVAMDRLGNRSARSDTLAVRFEPTKPVDWPEVFRGPDVFRVYTAGTAFRVTVDLYTVAGELVASLAQNGPAQIFDIEWDLRNNDGEEVRNGPYLAVIEVESALGRRVLHKAFVAVVR